MAIIQIVPRLPPAIDGVGDYAYLLARQLCAAHGIHTTFVVCGAKSVGGGSKEQEAGSREGDLDGFLVYRLRKLSAAELKQVLSQSGMPQTVLLQYVGYAYEKRGCPLWLARGLEEWMQEPGSREQGARSARRLVTMFHELFASGPPWRSSFWTSPLQHWILRCVASSSDRCFTNRAVSADRLASISKHPACSIRVLPVLSNLGESTSPLPLASRKPQMVLYDNFGRNPRVRSLAASLIRRACERMGIQRLVFLGRGDTTEWLTTRLEVETIGVAAPETVSRLLAESRAGCLDYFDGYLGKSGIFAAYSAHALLPLLVYNNHSEADGLEINRHFWAAAALPDETGESAQQEVAAQARRWYDAHSAAMAAEVFRDRTDGPCMLGFLWKHRLQPPFGSRAWWKQWANRFWTLRSMLSFVWRTSQLKRRGAQIGQGTVLSPIRLGGKVGLLRIGNNSFIGRVDIQLQAEVEIGSHVCINDGVRLITASHDIRDAQWKQFAKTIRILDYAWIATGAVILPGVTIGRGAVVGAYAVVTKDVADFAVAAGNPARVRENVRNPELRYNPTSFLAFQTAWMGKPSAR